MVSACVLLLESVAGEQRPAVGADGLDVDHGPGAADDMTRRVDVHTIDALSAAIEFIERRACAMKRLGARDPDAAIRRDEDGAVAEGRLAIGELPRNGGRVGGLPTR